MTDYSKVTQKAVSDYIATRRATFAVVITYEPDETAELKGTVNNWFVLNGHPSDWTYEDKMKCAWQMCSATADALKEEKTEKTRKIDIGAPKLISGEVNFGKVNLLTLAMSWPDYTKPTFFYVEFASREASIGVRWWTGDNTRNGRRFWAFRIMFGPIFFGMSRDI